MLDNLTGSGLSESEVVEKMQSARSGEDQDSAPIESTDETEAVEDEVVEEEITEADSDLESEEIDQDDSEAPETYTVKASGEELEVTFDELVENYEKGQDYYKKTSKLADERKDFEAETAKLQSELQAERESVKAIVQNLESLVQDSEQKIDWEELRDSDPSEYLRQREIQQQRKDAVDKVKADQRVQLETRKKELLQTESQKLLSVMGDEWKDPEVRQKELESMYNYAYERGITQEEASNILDHRFWLMALDASKYRALQKTGDAVKKQVRKAPKTVKSKQPIKRGNQEILDAKKRMKASGGKDVDATVALMQAKRNSR
jgi:hypothetical protein